MFGGIGAQLRLLSTRLGSCVENDMEVAARLAGGERRLPARVARSRIDPQEVSQITEEPDSDRRPRAANASARFSHTRSGNFELRMLARNETTLFPAREALRIIIGSRL